MLRLFDKFRLISAITAGAAFLKMILAATIYILSARLILPKSAGLLAFVIIWVIAGFAESAALLISGWREVYKKTGDNFLKAKLSPIAKDKNIWKFVLSNNLNLSIRQVSREFDVLITGAILGPALTGIYKIARQFAWVIVYLIEPASHVIYPELAHLAAEKRFSDMRHIAAKMAAVIGGISALLWLGSIFFGRRILSIAAGEEFAAAYVPMIIFMFAIVIWGFAFCLHTGLLAVGRAGKVLLVQTAAFAAFLPALYLLLVNSKVAGAAVAQIIYFVVYSLLMLLFFNKYIPTDLRRK
jgi:O-antigen/teichoic acid export membrane protein